MNIEEQKKLAEQIKKVGYAKCIDVSYSYTRYEFKKGDIGKVIRCDEYGPGKILGYHEHCYGLHFHLLGNIHPVEFFEVPTDKEILMHQLK